MWVTKDWAVTPAWGALREPGSDLAAIFLRGNPGSSIGSLGVEPWDENVTAEIAVSGYPESAGRPGDRQLLHADRVRHSDETRLYYGVDTSEGQSGGPVLRGNPAEGIVVGVHGYGFEGLPEALRENQWNSGVRITDSMLVQIQNWLR